MIKKRKKKNLEIIHNAAKQIRKFKHINNETDSTVPTFCTIQLSLLITLKQYKYPTSLHKMQLV